MNILKHGNTNNRYRVYHYKVECKNCGCIFECNTADFIYQERRPNGWAGVLCPECKTQIDFVPSKNIIEGE